MRTSEAIQVAAFAFFLVLAWWRALPARRRAKVTGLAIGGCGTTTVAAWLLPRLLPPLAVSVIRDWLPAALVLFVYWQAGEFFTGVNERAQRRLERFDESVTRPLLSWISGGPAGYALLLLLELAYLLCYPMIPMSVAALYLLRLARNADYLWTVVLGATYLSYGVLPFVQTVPPRLRPEPWLPPLPRNPVRSLNLWLLRHASIHVNTFPSAHVASTTAAAVVLLDVAPWPVGLLFLATAAAIAVGTFAGRYHFALDAIAGAALALIVYCVVSLLTKHGAVSLVSQ